MRAILVRTPGGPEHLYLGEYPMPSPGPGELLVRVRATSLNRADLLQREGKYPPPPGASPILGLDVAGTVAALGPGVTGWQVGDRVFGLVEGGGYAEYAVLPAGMAMRIPDNLSFEEAAAIPEVFLTAYQALCWLGQLQQNEHVLIHAGASGVGTAAIQLARCLGAHVHVTASASKHEVCRMLGAETTIDYRQEDFAERIQEVTGGTGVHLIIDFVGAPYLAPNLQCLAMDGRIVLLATLGGSRLEAFDLRLLFARRAQLIASTLRNRARDYKVRLTQEFAERFLNDFAEGRLRPVIDRIYNWTEVADAHRRMETNQNVGKIVLRIL
ncbi:MAG: NAD(P)H-quinone oxidoreductase [Rhodothermus sp.]|nr:NAD(P)H-quinone oxidoreductase [Rhodothermus sp.]